MLSSPSTWLNVSPVEVLITRACDPTLIEPNYALHLQVAEYINTKKANTPREASMIIARLANHRNPHIAILALSLLDTLVQSCGYPFHLQISTKEFLNELVRRFPERPPPFPGPVMSRILDLIHGWKEGICVESRWKEDFGNIRDMHRLLTFKGYRFRDLPSSRHTSLASASNLKSAEELEEEDRQAQSAKLQELIRRGTPRDLAVAQELMKSLAGANPDAKPDYRSQALTDLNKLEQKVILMNEMLDNTDRERGERFVEGDAYDQVATILKSARPKLQKWISDAESDDSESLDTFLQINDQINTVLNRYEAYKKGDYITSSNPIPAEYAPPSSSNQNSLSLIDLDDSPLPSMGGGVDDLAGLFGSGGQAQPSGPPMMYDSSGGSGNGAMRQNVGPIMLPGTPQPTNRPPVPASTASAGTFGAGSMTPMGAQGLPHPALSAMGQAQATSMGAPLMPQRPMSTTSQEMQTQTQGQGQTKDAFADLVGLF